MLESVNYLYKNRTFNLILLKNRPEVDLVRVKTFDIVRRTLKIVIDESSACGFIDGPFAYDSFEIPIAYRLLCSVIKFDICRRTLKRL